MLRIRIFSSQSKILNVWIWKELNILKRAFEERDLNFLIGDLSIGKSYLSSLFAREMRFNDGYSVISFSFNQNISSLKEGLNLDFAWLEF